jgi:hypothetical protein
LTTATSILCKKDVDLYGKTSKKSAQWALPPGFPAVVDGEQYWDGGLVSNTPLQWVIDSNTRHEDMLAFEVGT